MSIKKIEVYRANIPLKTPFVISLGVIEELNQIIVKIVSDDGNTGWGEAAPSTAILGENFGTVQSAIDIVAPQLIGKDPTRMEHLMSSMDDVLYGNTAAKASIDIALHDLLGNIRGEPVWKTLGGARQDQVETDYTVTIDKPDAMAKAAKDLVRQGFEVIKVKVGEDPEEDIVRLARIREAVGEKVDLRIDANQGWTRQEAVYALREMEEIGIQFAEQPIKAGDVDGFKFVRAKVNIPIMADETVHSPEDAMEVIKKEAADYINIKLMKAGGFWKAKKIAAAAEAAHVKCMIGGMVATDILGTAAVHLAGAVDNIVFRDLDMGTSIETPLINKGGSKLEKNMRTLPEAPGLGIKEVNEDLLGKPLNVYS
ncbi:dipeptide epimerase [Candidatus Bipolaricaulota bacterium]|nr:dipeptide epimerase [Candidatus Bipolaricaulota bacterium]